MELRAITRLFTNDDEVRLYRPMLKRIAGSTNAAILLSQMIYWSSKNNDGWFYKFNSPCKHSFYREGDSWEEELLFSRNELEGAKKKILMRVGPETDKTYKRIHGDSWEEVLQKDMDQALVLSFVTPNRLTYYKVNMAKINKELAKIYEEQDKLEQARSTENSIILNLRYGFSEDGNYQTKQNQEVEKVESSKTPENTTILNLRDGYILKPALDITKNTSKNTPKKEGDLASLSEDQKEEVKTALLTSMRLVPVSKAVSKKGVSALYLINELYPLAAKRGVNNVVNALKTIKAEANEKPINDLTALIISKI